MLYTYNIIGNNIYINETSIILNVILIIITHFFLSSARNRNPLVVILAFFMIFFYEMRVITLNYTEFSIVLNRADLNVSGVNYTLFYTIIAYLIFGWILSSPNKYGARRIKDEKYKEKNNASTNILVLLYISLFLSVMAAFGLPLISQIVSIASTFFFNIFTMMALAGVYFFCVEKISKKSLLLFVLFCILYVLIFTIVGRRSSLFSVFMTFCFVCLLLGYTKVKMKFLLLGMVLIPIMFFIFILATLARAFDAKNLSSKEQIELVKKASDKFGDDVQILLSPIFDRVGYLDYTTEMVANREHLAKYITPDVYYKSIIDNLLTPGFDIYDTPKVSNIISKTYSYNTKREITKTNLSKFEYKSDILTLFGEVYLVFGFICGIIVIVAIGLFIRRSYITYQQRNSIRALWVQILIISVFFNSFQSFGFDWIAIDVVSAIINYYIFKKLVLKKDIVPVKYEDNLSD